jgi:hypothetical protein
VIHLRKGERTETAESVMRMAYHDHAENKEGYFLASRNICERVAEMDDETYAAFQSKLERYHQLLTANKIDHTSLSANAEQSKSNWFNLFLLSPFFALGTIIWWIPGKISKWITDKTVTRIDFYTSVYNGVLGFMGLIWWVLWQIIFWLTGQKLLWSLMFVSPVFCFVVWEWIGLYARQKAGSHFKSLLKKDLACIDQMKQLRKEIMFVKS